VRAAFNGRAFVEFDPEEHKKAEKKPDSRPLGGAARRSANADRPDLDDVGGVAFGRR
jgi:hypothetical protein